MSVFRLAQVSREPKMEKTCTAVEASQSSGRTRHVSLAYPVGNPASQMEQGEETNFERGDHQACKRNTICPRLQA
jgi:hypothetical protein